MKININDVEKITLLLFSRLRDNIGVELDVENDFYWDITEKELYNPYVEPKDITLGQLSDDWAELSRTDFSENMIPYDLKRLASIIKALGIENQTAF